ncbi:uncharacterized protein LACBIDRAFT_305920 [Laccaria bicolor S238N-H82]|uniref:Predicted protein n=1 Tax=Laccaria bicolor (strain S238N-H82 / ATCC MYA-4686) TaxID=486041 RepID=B0CS90_LACBS|nr:uncharacterized protein LACBIDRAFT_305920 [Laccaria bicolor S238N-H82]EDR14805.1 predicted protein [Laccaria bicolor S238N-H82]|eukprot:XP_001875364.1 predicted protein [Laccaria bicolor S238N-H82]
MPSTFFMNFSSFSALTSTRSLNCLGRGTFLSPTASQLFHCRVVSQNRVISCLGNVCRAELVLRSARLGFTLPREPCRSHAAERCTF